MNAPKNNSGQCSCGSVVFETTDLPIIRGFCHCTICQNFNNDGFADVTVFFAKSVESLDEGKIDFKVYKQPPLVSRGRCRQCDRPVIEKVNIPLMPKLIIVPSKCIDNAKLLPEPSMHIFYDKRVNDIDDDLNKHHGFISSQLAFSLGMIKGMFSRPQVQQH